MSVVVRMEMPKNCYECEMRGAWAFCPIGKWPVVGYKKQRHEDCPIICQLAEGHGRLVDAEDLERYWLSRIALMDSCAGKGGILESVERSTLRSCIEDIGNSKTIVPAAGAAEGGRMKAKNWDTETADNCRLPELIPGICERCRDYEYCHRQLSLLEEDA